MFTDPFDDPTRWSVGDTPAGGVAYADGTLRITIAEELALLSSSRPLPDPVPVLRVEASVTVSSGDGGVGLACGTGGDTPDQLLGAVTTRNTWRLATLVDGVQSSIAEGPLPPDLDMGGGGSVTLGVECAATGTDAGDRIALWVDGRVVGDAVSGSTLGSWDRATVLAWVTVPSLVAFFDDAVVDVGPAYAPVDGDPAVLALLEHVPQAWRETCTPRRPVGEEGIIAGVVCAPAGDADQAEYYRYATPETLAEAFSALVAGSGQTLELGDCSVGPSELTWSIAGDSSGQLACFENRDALGGRVITWTDERLSILALGVRTTGAYPELYDWWLGAGPDG